MFKGADGKCLKIFGANKAVIVNRQLTGLDEICLDQ